MAFSLHSVRELERTYDKSGRNQRIVAGLTARDKAEIQRIYAIEKQLNQGLPVIRIYPPTHYNGFDSSRD